MSDERTVHEPSFPESAEQVVVTHPPEILYRPKFISAYDVAKLTRPATAYEHNYSFGTDCVATAKKLREIAEAIEQRGVVLEGFDILESATRNDYVMTVINVTFHRKT